MKIASRQDRENIHLLILTALFALVLVSASFMSSMVAEAPAATAPPTALEQAR
jgi:hypothetical protein